MGKKNEILKPPHVIKQGYPCTITSSRGKKISCTVRNIVVKNNGDWSMDMHRQSDDVFVIKLEWKE